MNTLDTLDAESLRSDVPDFRPGDTLKVHVRVIEGNRSRIQVFQGAVIRRQGGGIRAHRSSSATTAPPPGRQPRTSSSTATDVTSSMSDSAMALP